ncbi:helix-turn-helix domain-containing protein [Adlercreutzia caecimuris]|uniref:helix-turn-helix domain-containing protein n=1 Tax=Adlercreutzia caecimuris TaxID=671266 RepID=UPI00272BE29B|nr:helix-turn-helix transcriptional regulator [Adlercreutzia caecimuris]
MSTDERKKKLGKRIRQEREAQGISLRRFATMIGLGHSYLVDVENGRRNIGFDNLCKIADGLGVSIGTLADK